MELEEIYKTYFKDVFLYIRRLSGDEHIAEEITSETFFKAIQAIDSFRGECNIIKDILPLYAEDMVSEDTKALVEEHLAHCPVCKRKFRRFFLLRTKSLLRKVCKRLRLCLKIVMNL